MPNPTETISADYNWYRSYQHLASEAGPLRALFPQGKAFSMDQFPQLYEMSFNGELPEAEPLFDNSEEKRCTPSLLSSTDQVQVGKKEYALSADQTQIQVTENNEVLAAHVASLRRRLGGVSAALRDKLPAVAQRNPEGASILRQFLKWAEYPLRGYGLEAWSDPVFDSICSTLATLHVPSESIASDAYYNAHFGGDAKGARTPAPGTALHHQNFAASMDRIADLPFLPVFENSTRMVDLACDHALAVRTRTLSAEQDRLSRRLLLVQYDQLAGGILDSIRRIDPDKNPADFQRWATFSDELRHFSTHARSPQHVPNNLEGRRIALRQGWPVQDTELIGSLFQLQAMFTNSIYPSVQQQQQAYTDISSLIETIKSTRITDSTSRSDMLGKIEHCLNTHQKTLFAKFGLSEERMKATLEARKADQILPLQFLSAKELDEAARDYRRRKGLPPAVGSDGSPTGYYEQAVAGTEVLSRLSALYQRLAPQDQESKAKAQYAPMRDSLARLIQSISAFYSLNPPTGKLRQSELKRIENAHAELSRLAKNYFGKVRKNNGEPAQRKAAAEELRDFCAEAARTAAATRTGMAAAEQRRAKEQWRQEKDRLDRAAYGQYLDSIWNGYQKALSSPVPDPRQYRAAAERGYRIDELKTKLDRFRAHFLGCGLDLDQIGTLLRKALPNRADELLASIRQTFVSNAGNAIRNRCLRGEVPRQSNTAGNGWSSLNEKQKKAQADKVIREMLEGKYFDSEIFARYATPEQKLQIIPHFLPASGASRTMLAQLSTAMEKLSQEENLRIFRTLPEVLDRQQLHALNTTLDNDPVIQGNLAQTELPPKDAAAIEQLRTRIWTEETDPKHREDLLLALADADKLLSNGTEDAKKAVQAREHTSTRAINAFYDSVRQAAQSSPEKAAQRYGARTRIGRQNIKLNADDERVRQVMDMPKLPDRTRDAILKMLRKMDEMEMLPKDAAEFSEEEGAKSYGYRKMAAAKKKYRTAVQNGSLDELVAARADYDREYKNLQDLTELAREGFSQDYTGAYDLFVTRRQQDFPWELVNTPVQAHINSVYLMYQQMRKFHMSPEAFMEDFPRTLFQSWQDDYLRRCGEKGAAGKDFAADLDALMQPKSYETLEGWSDAPPYRCLPFLWISPEEEGFDREKMALWADDAEQLFLDMHDREVNRYYLLSRRFEDPLYMQLRSEGIQNLITVADEDRDYTKMLSLPGYDTELRLKSFSLDEYIQSHEIDAAGMERRLDTMLQASARNPAGPFPEELLAETLTACTKVLSAKQAQRDSAEYQALAGFANGLLGRLPKPEELNYTAEQMEALKKTVPETALPAYASRRADLEKLRAGMEKTLEQYGSLLAPAPQPGKKPLEEGGPVVDQNPVEQTESVVGQNPVIDQNPVEQTESVVEQKPGVESGNPVVGQKPDGKQDDPGKVPVQKDAAPAEHSQKQRLTIEISDPNQRPVGLEGGQRFLVTLPVPGSDGTEGVFTPERHKTQQQELSELEQRIAEHSPSAAKAIRMMTAESPSFRQLCNAKVSDVEEKQKADREKHWSFWEYDRRYDACLREVVKEEQLGQFSDQNIADAIDDYLLSRARIAERHQLRKKLELSQDGQAELRSGAMSAVAEALGIGSLLAASRPVTLVRQGREVQGVFTERPKGSSCMNPAENDPILEMTRDSAYSAEAKRQLASIQVLDYLCGNTKRDPGSLRCSFTRDSSGGVVLAGIQGVDNDLCFMGSGTERSTSGRQSHGNTLANMPKSLADRVLKLDGEGLKETLKEFLLPEKQITLAVNRLEELQERITRGEKFFEGKDSSEVSKDCIHVLPDEAYETLLTEALPMKALLDRIPETARQRREERESLAVRNAIREDERALSELWRRTEAAEKNVWFGSKEFETMKKALLTVGQQRRALVTLSDRQSPADKTTDEALAAVRTSYEQLDHAAKAYLARKEDELKRKGDLDQKSRERVWVALQIREMLEPQKQHLKQMIAVREREAEAAGAQAQTGLGVQDGTPTAQERLNKLVELLSDQVEKRRQVQNGQLSKDDKSIMDRKKLSSHLKEGFALVELRSAAGSDQVKVDDYSLKSMVSALNSYTKENPAKSVEAMREALGDPEDDGFENLHQDRYEDLRKAIRLSMKDSARVAERLQTLTDLLKSPESAFAPIPKLARKLQQESPQTGDVKRTHKNNSKPSGAPGLK